MNTIQLNNKIRRFFSRIGGGSVKALITKNDEYTVVRGDGDNEGGDTPALKGSIYDLSCTEIHEFLETPTIYPKTDVFVAQIPDPEQGEGNYIYTIVNSITEAFNLYIEAGLMSADQVVALKEENYWSWALDTSLMINVFSTREKAQEAINAGGYTEVHRQVEGIATSYAVSEIQCTNGVVYVPVFNKIS